ncbi:heavy metal translocating P-type ATPase [Neisseria sp. Ec49-e6-T10]|uniref:heavy metal translocating P-type ATPase n=1 Tax=Neisseria sp. Ec49-e6-T10 TaxID=3140744 RepID=UPI003EB90BFD
MAVSVIHQIPGRVRFRVPDLKQYKHAAGGLHLYLAALTGVKNVRLRPEAASVVIEYDIHTISIEQLQHALSNLIWENITQTAYETEYCGADNLMNLIGLAATQFLPKKIAILTAATLTAPTIIEGFTELSHKQLTVEVLDALALSLSLFRQDYRTAMLTQSLLTFGEYMEQQTTRRSDELLTELMHPKSAKVWIKRKNKEIYINTDDLRKNDLMILGPGDMIVADGTIISGLALINQATMTGESLPVRRSKGAWVYSGTVIQEGNIVVQAEKVGAESSTAHIRQFIIDSLSQRSYTQQVTQQMADRRVLITLAAGASVFALTQDINRLASVFLVDYSCALKLSTPIAFKSIMYRAAQNGLLLKGGHAIEQLADVDTIVFDKTGTLTHGDMLVTDVVSFDSEHVWAEDLLAIAASVEEHSNHPLAAAIVQAAGTHNLPHIDHGEVEYVIAHGLMCELDEHAMVIGSRHFLEKHHDIDFAPYEAQIEPYEYSARHLLYISLDGRLSGMIGLKDHIREEAFEVIKQLKQLNIKHTVLLTGDKYSKAKELGDTLGIDEVIAQASPEDKVNIVKQLQAQGKKVWFVGDGVNDAPVLTQADIGLAMQKSTELAQQAADAVLLQDSLIGVLTARQLALEAMKLVSSNIKITEWINTGIMLAAALGHLSPASSALLHNGTTISVLLRALLARNGSKK